MGSDEEKPDPYTIPKLPLFSLSTPNHLTEPSGASTPPLQTSASVPFQWEEQPGKPRPCTDIILASTINPTRPERCLELPPRLAILESKTTSPTTVLDGPGDIRGKYVFSSSFRFAKERRRVENRQVSFDSNCSSGWSPNDDVLLLGGNGNKEEKVVNYDGKGLFGSFRLRGKDDKSKDDKGSFVISPSSMETVSYFFEENKGKRMRRNSSLSKVTRSHFWVSLFFHYIFLFMFTIFNAWCTSVY